jgi:nicotinamidase-related amidase
MGMDLSDVDVARPALLIIDMQNSSFRCKEEQGALPVLLESINELIANFRAKTLPVICVSTMFKKDGGDWDFYMRRHPMEYLLEGSEGVKAVEGLNTAMSDMHIAKTRFSAFVRTALEKELHGLGVDSLVICGVYTNWCVGWTAIDAWQRDFEVVIAKDGIFSRHVQEARVVLEGIEGASELKPASNSEIRTWLNKIS